MSDTIAAIATGAQVSAIGIIRLSGDRAINIVDSLFFPASGKAMRDSESRKLIYGSLRDRKGELLDLCLCTISRGPNSYTGEDTAELQCHGSPVVLRAALEEIFALGARQAGPGEFTKRAFLSGRMELTAAIRARHVARLQSGECSIELGFILADLLGNLERVSDHCSNIAVAVVELSHRSFDTHRYLSEIRSDSEQFRQDFHRFSRQFSL